MEDSEEGKLPGENNDETVPTNWHCPLATFLVYSVKFEKEMKHFERTESKYSFFKNKGLVNIYGSTDRFKRTAWERELVRGGERKRTSLICVT